ncbi:MAG: homoserine dehydrogenase [Chlorobi bacterium]|nr:homoserine dehydrogenase [Chlorobiota bacterium]
MHQHKIKLGIFGFGVVGQGLYQTIKQTKGLQVEVIKICVKNKSKKRLADKKLLTFNKSEILNNKEINVIVELTNDTEFAFEIVKEAIKRGKAVVTANKKMVAGHQKEIFDLQQKFHVPVLYEASSCGSIPIIRNLEEYYDNDSINAVEGIFNGATNYILTKIFDDNKSYSKALKEAQEKGFAETEPNMDVGGYDSKYKLCIIITHVFGVFVKPEQIFNYGIEKISDFDIKIAKEKNCKIKLIAFTRKIGNEIFGAVFPTFVKPDNILYSLENEYNGVVVEGAFSEKQFFLGKGAGSYPTGSAVLSDISALRYGYKYEYKKYFQDLNLKFKDDFLVEVYARSEHKNSIRKNDFASISEEYKSADNHFIIGKIRFSKLTTSSWIRKPHVNVLITPENKLENLN